MKTCTKCLRHLPTTSFGLRKDGKSGIKSHCYECNRSSYKEHSTRVKALGMGLRSESQRLRVNERSRERNAKNRSIISRYKLWKGCRVCGFNKSAVALDLHHIDPITKKFDPSSMSRTWKSIKVETRKCAVLCANCHRMVEAGEVRL